MPSTTRTRTTKTTTNRRTPATGSAGSAAVAPVSAPAAPSGARSRTDAEDKLWAALRAIPGSTTTDLSTTAKIGKSTAQKILTQWAQDGTVTRAAAPTEGGRRAADVWTIPDTDTPVDTDADPAPATESAPQSTRSKRSMQSTQSTRSTQGTPSTALSTQDSVAETGQDARDKSTATTGEPADTATTVSKRAVGSAEGAGGARLASGALRGMVEDYLRDHPGAHGPSGIARALGGKSSGAVSNALDKLVADGVAVKTQDAPKRFALAPNN